METEILEELASRAALVSSVDKLIEALYQQEDKRRIKRGRVQERIASLLGIPKNNIVCSTINDRMAAKGFRPYISKGSLYFENVSEKPSGNK